MDIKQLDQEYIAKTYARNDIVIASGNGAILQDINGKEYIDFGSGIAVNCFGVADSKWIDAVTNQAMQLAHISNLYYTLPQVHLAKLLCEKSGMKRVFFGNSGAEANECAIKVARKYGKKRNVIVTLEGSFHGRTLATLAATGQEIFHQQYQPLPKGFKHVKPNNIEAIQNALDEGVCAVMLEMVQGEGGVNVLNEAYVKKVRSLCDEHNILLLVDEVQTGIGRTGQFFAYEHFGILPDVVTSAKGLGGGLPISACLLGEKVKNIFTVSDHGSTFGGNPICASGAISIVERMDNDLYQAVKAKSDFIFSALAGQKGVVDVTGLGLMIGIETQISAKEVLQRCIEKGLLVLTAKDKVRLLPPLNISMKELEKGMSILIDVLGGAK